MKKKKILFVNPYPESKAPSQRLKFEQYYPHFRNAGFEVHTSAFMSEVFWEIVYKPGNLPAKAWYTFRGYLKRIGDLLTLRKYDIVYVHLWVTPLGPPLFEWLFRKFSKTLVYDIDDLIFLKPKSKSNSIVNFLKSGNKSIFLMKVANHVITCTPYLDQFVRKYNNNTTDISSTIKTDIYIPKQNYSINNKLALGWSGSHSTSKYLYLLSDVLKKLKNTVDFKLLVIGDPNFDIEGLEVEAINWNEDTEVMDLLRIDIGLYPLPNEEWVLGKSGLKALQYMALGIPTVATAIGANYRIIENNVSGYLVNTNIEWYDKLLELAIDENLRQYIGQNASKRVEKYYSVKVNSLVYLRIFDSLNT